VCEQFGDVAEVSKEEGEDEEDEEEVNFVQQQNKTY